ncbi:MAG TPA: hypothetical protein VH134_05685 [Candidatus Dormibacteraeota bacterium]|nr:hypothetical protein [Candidatus Dormibacteraeota bacterium]
MRPPLLPAALPLAALLAGCGHGIPSTQASSTTASSRQAAGLRYAQCMRSHGVNIPDPQSGGSGGGLHVQVGGPGSTINIDGTTFQNAQTACQSLLPNGGQLSPQQQAQAQQNALNFARCMRAHGVDIPDPQPGNGGIVKIQPGSGAGSINPDDPNFQNAQKACGSQLGKVGGFSASGTGGGGGGGGAAIGFGSAVAAG